MGDHTSIKSIRKNSERIDIKLREKSEIFNWDGLKFPVNLNDINNFENYNSSIAVNVIGYEILVYPLRISNHNYKRERTVNLLLISDDTKQHYCWITDISKLLSLQTSKHGNVRHVCFRCLHTFNSEKSSASHHDHCKSYEYIKFELSEEGSKLSFLNNNRSMRVPFIVDADFEFFTPQLSTCQPNPGKNYTNQYQKHIDSGFCYHIKCFDDKFYSQQPVTFVKEFNDDDIAQMFIDIFDKNIKDIYKEFKFPKDMIITMHDKLVYDKSTLCHISNKELGEDKVCDHCHLSGKFRGAAHDVCKLKYKVPKFFPVVFHSLSGYNRHLFFKTFGNS